VAIVLGRADPAANTMDRGTEINPSRLVSRNTHEHPDSTRSTISTELVRLIKGRLGMTSIDIYE
jgi:hypothetical protein